MDSTFVFDLYDGGLLDVTILGLAQADQEGNVNVSKFAHMAPGSGGFCNICHQTQKIVFCGTFTTGGLQAEIVDGQVVIRKEGKVKKFVSKRRADHALRSGGSGEGAGGPLYHRAGVFRLDGSGLALVEVAPGSIPRGISFPRWSSRLPFHLASPRWIRRSSAKAE